MIKHQVRISLNAQDFKALVNGQIIEPHPLIQICLQDIGYDMMNEILLEAEMKLNENE